MSRRDASPRVDQWGTQAATAIDHVLSRLSDVTRTASGWMAKCPAHDDRKPSLSIRLGEGGRILLHCHASCEFEAVLGAAGLTVADLSPGTPRRQRRRSRIVATYPYRGMDGELLYEVVRLDPKGFRSRRPAGSGRTQWSLGSVGRVLYRLPELHDQEVVYVVEGEKDADALAALGLATTCNVGGAGKWQDEYAWQLKELRVEQVVILPDNDAVGRKHAQQVAASCHAAGLHVRVLELPGLREKEDVSDWLMAGGTRDGLARLVDETQMWAPTPVSPAPQRIRRVRLDTVEPQEIEWLWPGRLAVGKLHLLVGDPGTGKSTVAMDVIARLSTGRPWPDGEPGVAPSSAVLLQAEDGLADTVRPRLDRLGADPTRIHVLEPGDGWISLDSDLAGIREAVASTGARLLVIDPLTAYLGSRINSYRDADVRRLLGPLVALAAEADLAVLAIMHLRKAVEGRALHQIGGSVAFPAAARLAFAVAPDPDDQTRRLFLPVKSNVAREAAVLAFRLNAGGIDWEREPVVGITANDVFRFRSEQHREDRASAEEVLKELLANEEWPLPARIAQSAAQVHSISYRSLQRAARRSGIQTRRVHNRWIWCGPVSPDAVSPCPLVSPSEIPVEILKTTPRRQGDTSPEGVELAGTLEFERFD